MTELDKMLNTSEILNQNLNEQINELEESVYQHLNADDEYKKYILTELNIFTNDHEEKLASLKQEKSAYESAIEIKEQQLIAQQQKIQQLTEEMSNTNIDKDKLQSELVTCNTEFANINQEKAELEETQKYFMEKIYDLNSRILTVSGIIQNTLNTPSSKINNTTLENILQKLSANEQSGGRKKRKKTHNKKRKYKRKSKKRRKYKINNY